MPWNWETKFSEGAFKKTYWAIGVAALITYALLNGTPWSGDLFVLSIANYVLLVGLALALLLIVKMVHQMQTREEEMRDMRSDFVAVASHELRSPLSAVRWYLAELRGDTTLSQDARKITNDMYERICSLIDLTTTFLLMTTADRAPIQATSMKTINIAPILRDAITAAIATARARKIKIDVQAQLDGQILVTCDAVRLRIVFDNLLSNAIKYSHEGTTVTFKYEDVGNLRRFSIHDTGIGVPKDEIERIFSGFHRAANAKRSGKLGSGFGLYMAKKIVEMHGGNITCESSEKSGTTFTVTLPSTT